jgi:ABC-type cobalamin/Fe3+-siderophores transport system ATPase subunit
VESFSLDAESLILPFFNGQNLAPISVNFPAERVSFLLGENGSGKSTLMKVLLGIQAPIAGSCSTSKLNTTARAKALAWVDQNPSNDFSYSAFEVVAMSDAPAILIESSLVQMGIAHLRDKPMNKLSGGEQRRVHLARAFAQNTPWLLMDEPGANLDISHEIRLFENLGKIVDQQRSVLLSTHNLRHVRSIPQNKRGLILIMKSGEVQFKGNASDEATWLPALARSLDLSPDQLLAL